MILMNSLLLKTKSKRLIILGNSMSSCEDDLVYLY